VLAIKQTLYRTSADSPIVRALIRAAENGKQVTAVVELKARFDEAPNIQWARRWRIPAFTSSTASSASRPTARSRWSCGREGNRIKRYVHLSTGNYNPSTARIYGDLSYFTARDAYADDAGALFNLLTGYSSPPSWKRFAIAPHGLQERIIALIEREAALGRGADHREDERAGRRAGDQGALPGVAGGRVDRSHRARHLLPAPGRAGTSDNIRVISIVDRFLEHARIFHFGNGGKREVYLSSADWMPRNFQRRIEVMFPVDDEGLRDRVIDEILAIALKDNVKARR
jgi:polyphosphate kinase